MMAEDFFKIQIGVFMDMMESQVRLSTEEQRLVFGFLDEYLKRIEKTLRVNIVPREESVKVLGPKVGIERAVRCLETLKELAVKNKEVTAQQVDYTLALVLQHKEDAVLKLDKDIITRSIMGKPISPRTVGQQTYVDTIRKKMITFGIGPAGTGKTYLAMAMAIQAFKNDEVNRLILTRPAIEAGEKLGFLPGDLQSKIDPYLRPLYDALYEIMGAESFLMNQEKGLIEVAPLAYMRGRTLDHAYIILDEAQNTTPAQMKMFLTRVGFGSKVIVTGDLTQKDLPKGQASGLDTAVRILSKVDEIGFVHLTNTDVVRHPLVQKIVKAYEDYEDRGRKEKGKSHVRLDDGDRM